jgi:hypothetical protein
VNASSLFSHYAVTAQIASPIFNEHRLRSDSRLPTTCRRGMLARKPSRGLMQGHPGGWFQSEKARTGGHYPISTVA